MSRDSFSDSSCTDHNDEYAHPKHCHVKTLDKPMIDTKARCKLIIASILCLTFMTAELIGGILANSLALSTDAAHLLTDFAGFMIKVMGVLVSVLLIWVVTGILVYMAVMRILSGHYELDGGIMLITSALGILFNVIMLFLLQDNGSNEILQFDEDEDLEAAPDKKEMGADEEPLLQSGEKMPPSKGNINVRAAFIHALGDLMQSIGVLTAAFIIYFKPEYKIADPICTFFFSVLVLITTINILRDTLNVLMEGTPRGISFDAVKRSLGSIPGVLELHNLRIWSLTMDRIAVAVHLALAYDADHQKVSLKAGNILRKKFGVHEFTIQTEQFVEDMKHCAQCQNPTS
ncbi:hypothetical protein LSH36_40g03000 [Paralvinella palmiformis]|uniref:Uncharacterized protein n=1 Tax=Paralvinella palmiformis TaxID=53620 RepID=A0AAD9K730_9ANNE|nr:hypothetical protein LSH36_40g03000 [Paralvinella palmiformis]